MKTEFSTITVSGDIITTIELNRPEVHNAMNDVMITELKEAFKQADQHSDTRVIVLRGRGKSFCAGADLNYMKSIATNGFEENIEDSQKLAALFKTIYDCPVPTIALIHGAAYGGANGLLAACDIVIAESLTTFAFSEVKLGITPATISPFVIKRVGEFGAKELMMTGKRFKSEEARKWNLVNHVVDESKLDETLDRMTRQLLSSGPLAIKETKKLIRTVVESDNMDELIGYTTNMIANLRASDEGQEGMAAFLEKRKANWVD